MDEPRKLKDLKLLSVETTNQLTRAKKSGPKEFEEELSKYNNDETYRLVRKEDLKKICEYFELQEKDLSQVTQKEVDEHTLQSENHDRFFVVKYYRASLFLENNVP